MYSSLTRRRRQIIEHFFPDENKLSNRRKRSLIKSVPIYIKLAFCILMIYYLNMFISYRSMVWNEKSFQADYQLTMTRIDVVKVEENADDILGPPINYLSNRFLIENEYLCGRSMDLTTRILPHLIIFVKSNYENVQQREAIRLTWGNQQYLSPYDARIAFVLGTNSLNLTVKDESNKYGDIIQIDHIDQVYSNSRKMIMMLRWIDTHCSSKFSRSAYIDLRKYVLFVNDDFYIDIQVLKNYLQQIDDDREMTTYERRVFTTGQLIEKSRPERFVNNRWYIPMIDYPYNEYPSLISTECFLMTRYSARLFYIGSKYTRLFPFDHVYLGLVAHSMSVQFIPNNRLFSTTFRENEIFSANQTDFSSKWKRFLNRKDDHRLEKKSVCYRGFYGNKLIKLWNEIHHTNLSLSSS